MEKSVCCVAVIFDWRSHHIEVDSEILVDSDFDISKFQVSIPTFLQRLHLPFKVDVAVGFLPKSVKAFRPAKDFNELMWDIISSFICLFDNVVKDYENRISQSK